jgi:hypothetical protein
MQYLISWSVAFSKPLIVKEEMTKSSANNYPEIVVPVTGACA